VAGSAIDAVRMQVLGFRPCDGIVAIGALPGIVAFGCQGAVTPGTVGVASVVKGHICPSSTVVAVGALPTIMRVRGVSFMTAAAIRIAGVVEFDGGQPCRLCLSIPEGHKIQAAFGRMTVAAPEGL
jgi:hypothetical protein